jgi:hypothetical protein
LAGILANAPQRVRNDMPGLEGTKIDVFEASWHDGRVALNLHWGGYGKKHKRDGKRVKIHSLMDGYHRFGV